MKTWAELGESGLFRGLIEWYDPDNEDLNDADYDFTFGDVEWYEVCDRNKWVELPDFDFRTVESYGGEGQGDDYWFVIEVQFEDQIKHFKISGYYASYDGGYYDTLTEVKPKEKVITVWTTAT